MSFSCLVNEACRTCDELSSLLAMSVAARSMSSKASDSSLILLQKTEEARSPGGVKGTKKQRDQVSGTRAKRHCMQ